MKTNSNPNEELVQGSAFTKSDFRKMFTRSCTLDSAWNYERQQNLAFGYMMSPVVERLYDTEEDRKAALERHLEFMAVTPHISTMIVGVAAAMEEENAKTKEFDASSINAVKTSLMGPLAGIGDSLFWGTLKLIAAGIGIALAQNGSILGPILFFLIINIPAFLARYYSLKYGYQYGVELFGNLSTSGIVPRITKFASTVGLATIGGMIASMVYFSLPFNIGAGDFAEPVQGYIDQIMPALFPALFFGLAYWLLGKKVKTTTMLIWLMVICIVLAYFGIV